MNILKDNAICKINGSLNLIQFEKIASRNLYSRLESDIIVFLNSVFVSVRDSVSNKITIEFI